MTLLKTMAAAAISLLVISSSARAEPTATNMSSVENSATSDQCKQVAETLCRSSKKKGEEWYQWCLREQYANCMHQNPSK